jgi:putative lipoprotein
MTVNPDRLMRLCVVLLLLTAACGSREQAETGRSHAPEATPATGIVSGFAVHGHEVRSFRPCGAAEPLWAIDTSGVLWELHDGLAFHNEPYEEVFAIVEGRFGPAPREGFGASYPGALEIDRVLYMAQEGFRCNLDLSEFHYRGFGNEPFWSISISTDGIVLKMPGSDDRAWTDIVERPADTGITYMGTAPAGSIEVSIVDVPCRDSMSGAYFALSATVNTGGMELRGCALKGTGTP